MGIGNGALGQVIDRQGVQCDRGHGKGFCIDQAEGSSQKTTDVFAGDAESLRPAMRYHCVWEPVADRNFFSHFSYLSLCGDL